jgi:hypothetical protein
LSSTHGKKLEALFASVPLERPVLMDLTNFEGMGTLLYPLFFRSAASMFRELAAAVTALR